jgi:hypothetical protein
MRAAGLPDDLEMILEEHRLGVSAALFLFCRISIQMNHFFLCRFLRRRFGLISQLVMTK